MDDIESATEFFTEGHHVTVIYTLEGVCVLKSSWDFKDPPDRWNQSLSRFLRE